VKIEYDREADAVYLPLVDEIGATSGGVAHMYPCDPIEVGGQVDLDFDAEGRLLGIEVLDASTKLPGEFLREIGDGATA